MPNEIIKQRIFWLSKLKIHNSESLSSQFFVAMSHNLMTKDCIKLLVEYLCILQYDEWYFASQMSFTLQIFESYQMN